MPLAYWPIAGTAFSQEPQNVEIMVNTCIALHNMLRTAGADAAGSWSRHTQQSASVGIYSHLLISKCNRRYKCNVREVSIGICPHRAGSK